MSRTYDIIDADGHVLEPLDLWEKYMDPAYRERAPRLIIDTDGKERLLHRGQDPRQPQGPRRHRGHRRAGRHGVATHHEVRRGPPGRLRPPRAHPRHGSRRHRRGLPLSEPRAVFSGAIAEPELAAAHCAGRTTAGSPTTATPTPTASSAWPCCRCSRSSWPSRRCASRARSSACAAASSAPIPTTAACCTTRTTSRSGTRWRSSTSRSACTRARAAACRRSASIASRPAARGTSSRTRWR